MSRAALLREVAVRIAALQAPHPRRVGIDGVDAAGKTTLADELAERLRAAGRSVIRASVDDFAHPRAQRHARGRHSPEGYYQDATDLESLVSRLLAPLGPRGSRRHVTRVFDVWQDCALEEPNKLAPADAILLLDGIFLQRPELRGHLDWTLFLDVEPETALGRALIRDHGRVGANEADIRELYESRYQPAQQLYFEAANPRGIADVVVDNNDLAAPFIVQRTGARGPQAR